MESEKIDEVTISVKANENRENCGRKGCENFGFDGSSDEFHEDKNGYKDSYRQKRKSLPHGVPRKICRPEAGKIGRRTRCPSQGNINRKRGNVLLNLYSSVEETIDEAPEYIDHDNSAESVVPNDKIIADFHLTQSFPSDETDVVLDNNSSPLQETDVVIDDKNLNGRCPIRIRKMTMSTEEQNRNDTKALCFLLQIHLRISNLGMIAHGLTGGVALAQCIFIFFFLKQNDSELLENYAEISLVFQSLYYLLLSISTMSVFDRYIDLNADFSQALRHVVDKPIRTVSLVSFSLALVFSVSLARLDDKISMYESIRVTHCELITWKILNLLRVLTCIIGWVTVALSPNDNLTARTAEKMITQQKEKDLQFLMANDNHINATTTTIES